MGLERIFDFLKYIENNKNIEVNTLKNIFPTNPPDLQEIQITTLNNIMCINSDEDHPAIRNSSYSGMELSWFRRIGAEIVQGGFSFSDWLTALSKPCDFWKIDFSLTPGEDIPENLKHFENLSWFEKQTWSDDWRFGCFVLEKGIFPPQIVFFEKDWYAPMNMSFNQYFDAMFDSCAIEGWQYFYIDLSQDIPNIEQVIQYMERTVRYLPELFRDMDFSYHKSKLEELRYLKTRIAVSS